jgi:hypothetical protein
MSVTYYVALPFVPTEEGIGAGGTSDALCTIFFCGPLTATLDDGCAAFSRRRSVGFSSRRDAPSNTDFSSIDKDRLKISPSTLPPCSMTRAARMVPFTVPLTVTSCATTLPWICAPSPITRSEARNSPSMRPKTCAGPLHSTLPTIDMPEPMHETGFDSARPSPPFAAVLLLNIFTPSRADGTPPISFTRYRVGFRPARLRSRDS